MSETLPGLDNLPARFRSAGVDLVREAALVQDHLDDALLFQIEVLVDQERRIVLDHDRVPLDHDLLALRIGLINGIRKEGNRRRRDGSQQQQTMDGERNTPHSA